jgi:hypothetical protein
MPGARSVRRETPKDTGETIMPENHEVEKFEDMEVWQKVHHLILEVYRMTRDTPRQEESAPVRRTKRASSAPPKRKRRINKANFREICEACFEELRLCKLASEEMDFDRETERAMLLVDRIAGALRSRTRRQG